MKIEFQLNGTTTTVDAPPMKRLLDVLREDCARPGTKEGCGEGECGACAVLVDGELVTSCLMPAVQAQGTEVRTVEGLATGDTLSPLQQQFLECNGAQCGICTPGMLIASRFFLDGEQRLPGETIPEALAGNLCRCTGYEAIFQAVERTQALEAAPQKRAAKKTNKVAAKKSKATKKAKAPARKKPGLSAAEVQGRKPAKKRPVAKKPAAKKPASKAKKAATKKKPATKKKATARKAAPRKAQKRGARR